MKSPHPTPFRTGASCSILTGRVAVVTGGASGIGRGIVASLREAGATVIIADIDLDHATATAKELGASAIRVDVTDRASVKDMSPGHCRRC